MKVEVLNRFDEPRVRPPNDIFNRTTENLRINDAFKKQLYRGIKKDLAKKSDVHVLADERI